MAEGFPDGNSKSNVPEVRELHDSFEAAVGAGLPIQTGSEAVALHAYSDTKAYKVFDQPNLEQIRVENDRNVAMVQRQSAFTKQNGAQGKEYETAGIKEERGDGRSMAAIASDVGVVYKGHGPASFSREFASGPDYAYAKGSRAEARLGAGDKSPRVTVTRFDAEGTATEKDLTGPRAERVAINIAERASKQIVAAVAKAEQVKKAA